MNDRTIGVRRRRVAAFFLFASDFRLVSCPRLIPAILDDYELAACKTLASELERSCSRLSSLQFANGPKRSMGHVLGPKKSRFLFRGAEADDATGRPCRFNPVNPCQRGLPGVA